MFAPYISLAMVQGSLRLRLLSNASKLRRSLPHIAAAGCEYLSKNTVIGYGTEIDGPDMLDQCQTGVPSRYLSKNTVIGYGTEIDGPDMLDQCQTGVDTTHLCCSATQIMELCRREIGLKGYKKFAIVKEPKWPIRSDKNRVNEPVISGTPVEGFGGILGDATKENTS
ncbi:hypothetical protein C8R44DRAFT_753118 [Mycena epipterygia]|nr:hypothetical protein C8R44DRAFT_753118 [Mycena epipterygia]